MKQKKSAISQKSPRKKQTVKKKLTYEMNSKGNDLYDNNNPQNKYDSSIEVFKEISPNQTVSECF